MNTQKADKLSGILLMALFAFTAFYFAGLPFVKSLSLSPLIVGILLGMIYANTLRPRLPQSWTPGIQFCGKTVLRTAIVFYGFRLTFRHIIEVGVAALVIDVIMVASVILLGLLIGKWMKLDRNLSLLTSSGSAICGAAAVLGTESVLKDSKPHQTAVAVTTVVIFGTISMFLYPALYRMGLLQLTPHAMGIFTGASVHEVAHVVGAGNAMNDATIANTSIIVKMTRVILLVPFLVIVSFIMNRKEKTTEGKTRLSVPWFAFGFLVIIAFNSLDILPLSLVKNINVGVDFGLTMAMTALGAESNYEKFKKAGVKPFILAFTLFIWLFVGGYFLTQTLLPVFSNL